MGHLHVQTLDGCMDGLWRIGMIGDGVSHSCTDDGAEVRVMRVQEHGWLDEGRTCGRRMCGHLHDAWPDRLVMEAEGETEG